MNRYVLLCRTLLEHPDMTQRELAKELSVSLGMVNNLIRECVELGYLKAGQPCTVTDAGLDFLKPYRMDGALFIAAGFGSRFVPLTFETPKGLLEVFGERMIERQICQLHEVGITDITIVVGYLKEKFEYLIDKYGVKLLYNPEYTNKNTLATIYRARKALKGRNMYILSSDNWMRNNMYHTYEPAAWYSSGFAKGETREWCLSFNKKGVITDVLVGGRDSWVMYGPVCFSKAFSERFLSVLEAYYKLPGTEQFYWEQVLVDCLSGEAKRRLQAVGTLHTAIASDADSSGADASRPEAETLSDADFLALPPMYINRQPENQVYEFENLEELREFDPKYREQSDNEAMELISKVFEIPESEITHIRCLKAGMTNKSFLFEVKNRHYICRIPGPGTELLINRRQEEAVYRQVASLDITEKVLYFNGDTGYKISEYYEGSRCADCESPEDMKQCMAMVRRLHKAKLKVDHSFDLRERIRFYERLCMEHGGIPFEDYKTVHGHMMELLDEIDALNRPKVLAHIDPVVDNFLFLSPADSHMAAAESDATQSIRLIDWEYAGMADPLLDVAMCSIYSYFTFDQGLDLLKVYLEREPSDEEKKLLISFMALGGFLWALWAVYKSELGEEFGEYTLVMYRYGKQGYKLVHNVKTA